MRRILLGWAVLGLVACGRGEAPPEARRAARTPRVGVLEVPTRDLAYTVEALGTIEARQVVRVPARVDGVVESLGFDEGGLVGPDTVLAVVDGVRRGLLLEQATKAVVRAQAAIGLAEAEGSRAAAQEAAARAGLAEAQGMLARREAGRAKAPGLVPEDEVEQVRAQVGRWQAQVDEALAAAQAARAQGEEAVAALDEARGREGIARRDAEDATVRPPLAGVVQQRHVVLGQWVRSGDPVATLVDASRLRLRFRIPEAESAAVAPGRAEISFRTAATEGRDLPAELLYVQGVADPATRMVECLAEVRDPTPALKPGFFASVTVRVRRPAPSPVVPEESLFPTERGLVVHVVRDGQAAPAAVRTGLRTRDGWVEVLEGLEAGASVAVENASVLQGTMKVDAFPSARGAAGPKAGPAGAAPGSAPPAEGGR